MDFKKQLEIIRNYVKEHYDLLEDLVKGVISDEEYDDLKYGLSIRYSEMYPELFET